MGNPFAFPTHPLPHHKHYFTSTMAPSSLLSLTLCLLFLSAAPCFSQRQWRPREQRFQTECQIDRLNAQKPQRRIESEAGVTEVWDLSLDQFQCAGVAPLRHRIQPRGLLLPHYNSAPQLMYVVQGRGVHGAVFPGCAETYQSESQSQSRRERGTSTPRDQHQKIRRVRQGDVIAFPAGTAYWIYNDGDSQLVLMALFDLGNFANQLDRNFRRFFLAGSPQQEAVMGGPSESSKRQTESESRREGQRIDAGNLLSGFDVELLSEALNIDPQLARRLQNRDDMRGSIVRVERGLDLISPEYQEDEQERSQRRGRYDYDYDNGLEETFCTMRLRHRLDQPSQADIFNPRAGRITTVNSFNFPVLQQLQLSAERGVLYRNAIYTPHWNQNAHSVVYITRGNGQIQIVREDGETVFNGPVEEGQIITVPQNFAVVKRANEQGLEWVAFKTNGNARISQLAGRVSVLRAIPVDVLSNSFRISREEARKLKESRDQEVSVLSPSSRFSRYAIEA